MCELCEALTQSYDEVLPGIFLVRATCNGAWMKAGEWALAFPSYPFLIWKKFPVPKPACGATSKERSTWDSWAYEVDKKFYFNAPHGHKLIKAATSAGYNETQDFSYWIANHIGEYLQLEENQKLL